MGSGIFLAEASRKRAKAIVDATTDWQDAKKLAEISTCLGAGMPGIEMSKLTENDRMAKRGW